jgi:hypothetical protein
MFFNKKQMTVPESPPEKAVEEKSYINVFTSYSRKPDRVVINNVYNSTNLAIYSITKDYETTGEWNRHKDVSKPAYTIATLLVEQPERWEEYYKIWATSCLKDVKTGQKFCADVEHNTFTTGEDNVFNITEKQFLFACYMYGKAKLVDAERQQAREELTKLYR